MVSVLPISPDVELTDHDFRKISALIYEQCGIHHHVGKKGRVKAWLGKRIRQGGFRSFRDYYEYVVEDRSGQESIFLLDSIFTNFTSFFREPQNFEYLRNHFLPKMAHRKKDRQLSFWSASCSSGEEVYPIAITHLEPPVISKGFRLKIFGTDISTRGLRVAQAGKYGLMESFSFRELFGCLFFRNVMIYFELVLSPAEAMKIVIDRPFRESRMI